MSSRISAELEQKRARLAEIRRQKEQRQKRIRDLSSNRVAVTTREDVDSLVSSLVGESAMPRRPLASGGDGTTPTTAGRLGIRERGMSDIGAAPVYPSIAEATSSDPGQEQQQQQPERKLPELALSEAIIADLPPREKVCYSKEVQTVDEEVEVKQNMITEEEFERRIREIREQDEQARKQAEEERRRIDEEIRINKEKLRELTEEEHTIIMSSEEFSSFIERSSRQIERALDEDYDFMTDYSLAAAGGDADDSVRERIKLERAFFSERLTKGRSVTDVCWSPKFAELFASAYNSNPRAPNDPDGVVAVWNVHLHDRPEFVFHSQSDVLRVTFLEFNPNLLIGGSYSGQILLWDTRAKPQPVLKTPLTAGGHTHPIYSLKVVGTRNAHQLISASTDGLVCTWQFDMLSQPQEVLELSNPNHGRTDEVAVTALDFPDGETVGFLVGTEEGKMYQANRYDRAGSKTGLNPHDIYTGHTAPITSLHFHPPTGSTDFSDLYLTSSIDWTTKLWRARPVAKPSSTSLNEIHPIHSFEYFDDYVYDAKWSPTHPAVFGTVDGSGRFGLWNLNLDTEVPSYSVTAPNGRSLNRLAWNTTGRRVAAGSVDGHTYIYDIGDLAVPQRDDYQRFTKVISELSSSNSGTSTASGAAMPTTVDHLLH